MIGKTICLSALGILGLLCWCVVHDALAERMNLVMEGEREAFMFMAALVELVILGGVLWLLGK